MRVTVTVKPGSKKGPLVIQGPDGALIVFLLERAIDGAANEGLVNLLAKHFEVSKSKVQIVSGFNSRIKRIEVDL